MGYFLCGGGSAAKYRGGGGGGGLKGGKKNIGSIGHKSITSADATLMFFSIRLRHCSAACTTP